MIKFNGLDIELTRGDSAQFKVNFYGRELPEDVVVLFTVKKRPREEDEPVIEKRLAAYDNMVQIGLSSADTNLKPRTYYWDIRVMFPLGDGTYEVKTPADPAAFTILEVVGDA